MKVVRLLSLCFLFSLVACGGGGADGTAGSAKAITGASTASLLGSEIDNLNQKFNSSEQYALTQEELQLLLNDGVITQAQYNELAQLAQN